MLYDVTLNVNYYFVMHCKHVPTLLADYKRALYNSYSQCACFIKQAVISRDLGNSDALSKVSESHYWRAIRR